MRTYVVDLAGGTATNTVQITDAQTLKLATFSFISAAVGKIELSKSVGPQIGTVQPTRDVIARLNCSATAGNVVVNLPISVSVKPLDSIYVHTTGAGNLGTVTLQ